jgi:Predicted transcription regulator containing HTH domain
METAKIENRKEYDAVMARIEKLLQKSTEAGGFDKLTKKEAETLENLSLIAEQFEDSIPLMPIKQPSTIAEMLRYKMFELNLKQKQLAKLVGVSETRISELLNGKRKLNIGLAKKLHFKLNIDADFLLNVA